ncbi:YkgJ family cysteine cluster protein [Magnetovibrio sp. PR-2]|uniref:YkgJ family cysteine cluster protein n=1 Tax=Magnetovibrio sp. PR-2 TaxID=3120356 RepID=UPI002FCDE2AE
MSPSADHPPYVGKLIKDVAQVSETALKDVGSAAELAQICEGIYGFAADILGAIIAQDPPPKPIDCQAGCWYCCTSPQVLALPVEVLAVAYTLTQGHTPRALTDLFDHHRSNTFVDLTSEGRICPLLQDSACSAYSVRPSPCRGFNAYDHTACKSKKVDGLEAKIVGYAPQGLIYQAAMTGLALGCDNIGLDNELVDLPSALLVAHGDLEGCTERWLTGKRVFAPPSS